MSEYNQFDSHMNPQPIVIEGALGSHKRRGSTAMNGASGKKKPNMQD